MALPKIDFRSFTVDDIRECLENHGYATTDQEFEVANDGAFKYIGVNHTNGFHRYLVGFEDDENTEQYYVSRVFVSFHNCLGTFVAEYGGTPECEGTREEIDEYIERICN